jgi:hypothetical protein
MIRHTGPIAEQCSARGRPLVDGGFRVNACSIRCSSMRCKHPFKKSISADLAFEVADAPVCPALLSVARKRVARPLPTLTPPAVQDVGIHLQRPRHLANRTPAFQPPHGSQLELLREHPSRQPHDSILLWMDFES